VLIETVGVGQSEIEINNIVDFVVFVVPPGSGDGLQGSKKGVMEIADMICITNSMGTSNQFANDSKDSCNLRSL